MAQLLTFLANVAVITALLVYFGWRRTETQAVRMGFDESILGLSTRDYLFRSVGPVLQLVAIISITGFVLAQIDILVLRRMADRPGPDTLMRVLIVTTGWAWLVLPLLVVMAGLWWPATAFVAFPLSIRIGALLIPYSLGLRARKGLRNYPAGPLSADRIFSILTVVLALFWATSNYAEVLGNQIADRIAANVETMTAVAVYSPDELALRGAGVHETRLDADSYHFRYTGLRLLEHTENSYVLMPSGWTTDAGMVFALPAGSPLRFEFGPGARL